MFQPPFSKQIYISKWRSYPLIPPNQDLEPVGGRAVIFRSKELLHEVEFSCRTGGSLETPPTQEIAGGPWKKGPIKHQIVP